MRDSGAGEAAEDVGQPVTPVIAAPLGDVALVPFVEGSDEGEEKKCCQQQGWQFEGSAGGQGKKDSAQGEIAKV